MARPTGPLDAEPGHQRVTPPEPYRGAVSLSRWSPTPDAEWSVHVRDLDAGPLLVLDDERLLPTASLAKVAALRALDEAHLTMTVNRSAVTPVADSGLWQHLDAESMTADDLAALVGATSDNLAANALIELLGLDAVQARARAWFPRGSMLHDLYRDARGPGLPPTVSTGCALDYADAMVDLAAPGADDLRRVRRWLSLSTDFSLVLANLPVDPLSHWSPGGPDVLNKTGCDDGVRADAGVVTYAGGTVVYAVIARWVTGDEPAQTCRVLADIRRIGDGICAHLGVPYVGGT